MILLAQGHPVQERSQGYLVIPGKPCFRFFNNLVFVHLECNQVLRPLIGIFNPSSMSLLWMGTPGICKKRVSFPQFLSMYLMALPKESWVRLVWMTADSPCTLGPQASRKINAPNDKRLYFFRQIR